MKETRKPAIASIFVTERYGQATSGVNSMVGHNLSSGVQMGVLRLVMVGIIFETYTVFEL